MTLVSEGTVKVSGPFLEWHLQAEWAIIAWFLRNVGLLERRIRAVWEGLFAQSESKSLMRDIGICAYMCALERLRERCTFKLIYGKSCWWRRTGEKHCADSSVNCTHTQYRVMSWGKQTFSLLRQLTVIYFLNFKFIYFWLRWIFVAVRGLLIAVASLVAECGL